MRAKTTPTERPLPEAAPKRARDACEDEADVRDDAGDAYAFKLLKLVLESMRPRSGTQQAWRDVELLVSHWKDRFRDLEAKESGGAVARKTTKTSSATRMAKMRLKDRVPAAAWKHMWPRRVNPQLPEMGTKKKENGRSSVRNYYFGQRVTAATAEALFAHSETRAQNHAAHGRPPGPADHAACHAPGTHDHA